MIKVALDRALDRALERDGDEPARADPQGGGAGAVERARVGPAPDAADRLLGHADPGGGLPDEAAVGERFDELALPLRRQAVDAGPERNRIEGQDVGFIAGRRFRRAGRGESAWRGASRFHSRV